MLLTEGSIIPSEFKNDKSTNRAQSYDDKVPQEG